MSEDEVMGTALEEGTSSKLLRGSSYIMLSLIIAYVLTFVTTIVKTRFLTKEDFGALAMVRYYVGALGVISVFGLSPAVTKFTAEFLVKDKDTAVKITSTAFTISLIASSIVALGFFLASGLLAGILGYPSFNILFKIAAVFIVLSAVSAVIISILQGMQRISQMAAIRIAAVAAALPANIVLILLFGLTGAVLSLLIAPLLSVLLGLYWIRGGPKSLGERLHLIIDKAAAVKTMLFAVPFMLEGFILSPTPVIIVTLLSLNWGTEAVADFKIAFSLSQMGLIIATSVMTPLIPIIYEKFAKGLDGIKDFAPKTFVFAGSLYFPGILALGLLSPFVVRIFGSDYAEAWPFVYILCIGAFLMMMSQCIGIYLVGADKPWHNIMINSVMMSMVWLAGSWFLVDDYGLLGVTISYVFAWFVSCTTMSIYVNRSLGIPIWKLWRFVVIAPISIAAGWFILHLYSGFVLLGLAVGLVSAVFVMEYLLLDADERKLVSDNINKVIPLNKLHGKLFKPK